MSLQNILGNMLSGLAGQMAKGQGKGEALGMEELSGEFAGAFRQAVGQLSALKSGHAKSAKIGEESEADMALPADEEALLSELTELVAALGNPVAAESIRTPEDAGTDLLKMPEIEAVGADTKNSAEPVGDTDSQESLTMGVMPEGKDAAGLAKTELPQNASPQAKAILAELMSAWSAQVSTAGTLPLAAAHAPGLSAGTGSEDSTLSKLPPLPQLPAMPNLPPNVREMLEQKGFTFETGEPEPGSQTPPDAQTAIAEKVIEKETVNNPASSKAGEAAALSEATLPPHSFSSSKAEAAVATAAEKVNAKLSETGALQAMAATAGDGRPDLGLKGQPASDPAGQEKAVEALKNVLENAPPQAKPALQQVLDKLQDRVDADPRVSEAVNATSEPSEPDIDIPIQTPVDAPVSRMADQTVAGSTASAGTAPVDAASGLESALPTPPSASPGKDSLANNIKGAAGTGVVDQVVNAATFSVQNGRKEVTLQLNPHELGDVRVRLSSDSANQVSARLIATSAEAHEMLSQQIDSLQKSMEAQGIRVERIQVVLAGEGAQNAADNQSRSDTPQPGTQQQAFQDLAQQHYRNGRQDSYATAPTGPAGNNPGISGLPEPDEAVVPGESRNDNGRVSLLI